MKKDNILKQPILYLICGFFLFSSFSTSETVNRIPNKKDDSEKMIAHLGTCADIYKEARKDIIDRVSPEELNIYLTGTKAEKDSLIKVQMMNAMVAMTERTNYCYVATRFGIYPAKAIEEPAATIRSHYDSQFKKVRRMIIRHHKGIAQAPKRFLGRQVCRLMIINGVILDSYGQGVETSVAPTKALFESVAYTIA